MMSIVTDIVTIDILDHFYAQMSIVTYATDMLDQLAMMHCCILAYIIYVWHDALLHKSF